MKRRWLSLVITVGIVGLIAEASLAAGTWVRYGANQYQTFYINPNYTKKMGTSYRAILRYETKVDSSRWIRKGPFYIKNEVRLFEMDCALKTATCMEASFFDEKDDYIDGLSEPTFLYITPTLQGPVPQAFRMLCSKKK